MNSESKALAEYLEKRLDRMIDIKLDQKLDQKFDQKLKPIKTQLNDINRTLLNLINHVDGKNDKQDDIIDNHELRINSLESDFRALTS